LKRNELTKQVSKCFKDYAKVLGIKQKDAAKELGLSEPAYSQYCSGKRVPTLHVLRKISKRQPHFAAYVFYYSVGFL
jgi:transcriptional regulator with XRE-family HTH domain